MIVVFQIDPDYISYDDIFKRKHNGKSMLKDKHPAAWKALHAIHHIVRGWFKDWETDQRQHDILHLNFTKYPRMKDELNEFIRLKMAELPALVLAVGGSNGTATYLYKTILASQSLVGNKHPGGQYSQLLWDEPELMNRILDGERLGLHLMKNKPTIDTLVAREKTEISQSTSEVVKLAGMGTPVTYGQKEPYITFKGMELKIARSYTRIMTDEEVFNALWSARWEFKSKGLGDGGQSLAKELSRNKEKKSVKPEDPKIHISESSLIKEEEKENTVGEEYKRRNKKDEGIGTAEQTVGRSDAEVYVELPIDKEENRNIVVADSMPVNLHTDEDVTNKLSDGALEIVIMVIVGCDTKDELALVVSKFIAHVNKQDGSRRPFTGHKGFTVLEKCRMIVDYALASEKVSLIGRGRMKHHKIVLDRTNVHST
ncbi:hypothetical protein R1flu_024411 [Riccia fluitans]|uniref:Uncharacterized protein n=1 Tax=Riccia fluitans TaxID=41844 RepID=A0ABD1XVA3_9MARC